LIVKEDETDKITNLVNEITSGKAEINVGQAAYYSIKNGRIIE
jgi:hypothetical protein